MTPRETVLQLKILAANTAHTNEFLRERRILQLQQVADETAHAYRALLSAPITSEQRPVLRAKLLHIIALHRWPSKV